MVQGAWERGQPLVVHGWIYDIADGLLRDLAIRVGPGDSLDEAYRRALEAAAERASVAVSLPEQAEAGGAQRAREPDERQADERRSGRRSRRPRRARRRAPSERKLPAQSSGASSAT